MSNLFVLENSINAEYLDLIEKCKSKSMTTGFLLRKTHYLLGEILAIEINNKLSNIDRKESIAVFILMRAGLNFGLGIADKLELLSNSVSIYFVHNDILDKNIHLNNKNIIIVDAVINSGKSLDRFLSQFPKDIISSIIVATTVIPKSSINLLTNMNLFTVRVSENQYQGAQVSEVKNGKGPDTGDRLFGTLEINTQK